MNNLHNQIGDLEKFIDSVTSNQQDRVDELVQEIEESDDAGHKNKHQLRRHIGILLLIQSAMEDFM